MSASGLCVSSDGDDSMLHDENEDTLDGKHEDMLESSMSVAMLTSVVAERS